MYHPPSARDARGLAMRMVDRGKTPERRIETADQELTIAEYLERPREAR
jgi:hypothetical protein